MNGHGGARVGSGRKPTKPPKAGESQRFTPEVVTGGKSDLDSVSARPPDDLPEGQAAFWRTYAPSAIRAQTLTAQTLGAFRLLCELDEEKRETKATIDKDGRTYIKAWTDSSGQEHQELKAHPLTGSYRQLAQRVEALFARFGLAPFGKPVAVTKPKKPAANPWAKVAGQ